MVVPVGATVVVIIVGIVVICVALSRRTRGPEQTRLRGISSADEKYYEGQCIQIFFYYFYLLSRIKTVEIHREINCTNNLMSIIKCNNNLYTDIIAIYYFVTSSYNNFPMIDPRVGHPVLQSSRNIPLS